MSIEADNKEKDKDQADELREIFNEITDAEDPGEQILDENLQKLNIKEIDILQLPPRNEVHAKSKRVGVKVSKPFLRLVLISILVVAVIIGGLYLWDGDFTF